MRTQILSVTPTVTVGAYSANDIVGGVLSFGELVRASDLVAVQLDDGANQAGAYQLMLFSVSPPSAIADNGTPGITAADLANCVAILHLTDTAGADSFGFTATKAYFRQCRIGIGGGPIFGYLKALGTPTFTALCVTVKLHFDQVE